MKMSSLYKIKIALVLFSSSVSLAYETAITLPKGIYRMKLVGVQTSEVQSRYNNLGNIEQNSAAMNKSYFLKDLVSAKGEAKQSDYLKLKTVLNSLETGLGDELDKIFFDVYSDFEISFTTAVPALEYGVTSRLSIGIQIPIVKRRSRLNIDLNKYESASEIAQKVSQAAPQEVIKGLESIAADLPSTPNQFLKSALLDKGYEVPLSVDEVGLGDIEFGAKWNFYQNESKNLWLSTQLGIRAPTGEAPDYRRFFDQKTSGDGAWGMGVDFFTEYKLNANWRFTSHQSVKYFLADERLRAAPRTSTSGVPDLTAGDFGQVERLKGAEFLFDASAVYSFYNDKVITWATYKFENIAQSEFKGVKNLYYQALEQATNSLNHALMLGIGYSSVNDYRKGKSFAPYEVRASYYNRFKGINTAEIQYLRTDFTLYFK